MGQSATLAISEECRRLRAAGREVIDFGLGQSPFPVPRAVVQALRDAAAEKDYLPVKGLPALREAVAEFHRRHDGVDARSDDVLIGPGSKELMFLLQLIYYGEILVATPCWVSYLPQAQIIGRRVSRLHTTYEDGWKISRQSLLESIERVHDDSRPRILVLNYPDNPTGMTYTPAELEAITEVARRFRVLVLSDEIYARLHHKGEHVSIAKFYPEGTIISSGLSKWCGAGGWRLGTFLFPPNLEWLMEAIAAAASETYTSVCAPIQYAAVTAFRGGEEIERYLAHSRRILAVLGRHCTETLTDAGLRVRPPEGAFYVFIDFSPFREQLAQRGIADSAALCRRLLDETGVALLPGAAFVRPRSELTARLSYVDFDGPAALAASEELPLDAAIPEDFIGDWCGNVCRGVKRIADWVRSGPAGADAPCA
ncbi:MAG: aminotransferase class I/II-fold pyridoxal phosphate-dependent enzyme [Planctomycetes bacterium]|nr:aminotransferase class I/II-fold pyridoxal phosphate-dependent enzyme [Planctomycetota bacterium]